LRERGMPISSTWIDDGDDADPADLWRRCIAEASSADAVIAFHREGDVWKGAFVEIGAALAHGVPVFVVGDPPGSWAEHPLVTRCRSIGHAYLEASAS
jgi:nucleoside 2-deoxyribosyltransferase